MNQVVIKIGKEIRQRDNKELKRAIEDFCELKTQENILKEKLDELKAKIAKTAKDELMDCPLSTITLDSVKIVFGFNVKIEDVATLKSLLGKRFDDLVKSELVYKPEARLRDMAIADDGLRECINISDKAPSFTLVK